MIESKEATMTSNNHDDGSTVTSALDFNGGKMQHIFKFDDETKMYSPRAASELAETALVNGRLFYKIDGSNGMLVREQTDHGDDESSDDKIKFRAYQRLDTKGKSIPDNCIAIPKHCNNEDTYSGHSYCYEPILMDVEGKKAKKRNEAMLATVAKFTDHLLSLDRDYVSVEWVGKKFNKTPGVPCDIAVAIHSEQICEEDIDRTYDGMKDYLLGADHPIEGLLIEYLGTFWKVRADCFDRKCKFKTSPATARPPIYLSIDK